MKSLSKYIVEQLTTYTNNVPSDILSIIKHLINNVDFKKLQSIKGDDPDRFNKSKQNEQLFIDNFDNDDIKIFNTEEYYALQNNSNNSSWENLSDKEKSNFDTKYGDIILQMNNKYIYIDLKISDKYLGAVSLGSLVNFDKNGYYICINSSNGKYNIVSHSSLVDAVKEYPELLRPVINKQYKGYPVEWEGQQLTSEYFIAGKDIEKFK